MIKALAVRFSVTIKTCDSCDIVFALHLLRWEEDGTDELSAIITQGSSSFFGMCCFFSHYCDCVTLALCVKLWRETATSSKYLYHVPLPSIPNSGDGTAKTSQRATASLFSHSFAKYLPSSPLAQIVKEKRRKVVKMNVLSWHNYPWYVVYRIAVIPLVLLARSLLLFIYTYTRTVAPTDRPVFKVVYVTIGLF